MSPLSAASARRRFLFLIGLRWFPTGLLIPIFVLLILSRGLSLVEIGLVFSLQGLVVLVLELPTGGLSDAIGRRPVLILAGITSVVALATLYLADSVVTFAMAAILQGVFRALDSGPLEAWYVDTTLAADPDARIETGLGAAGSVLGAAIASGALLSGALVALDPFEAVEPLALPVLVALAVTAANLVAVTLLMREVRPAQGIRVALASARAVPGVVAEGLGLLRSSRVLLAIVLVELFWGFSMVAFESLFPLRLAEVIGGEAAAGAVMGPVSSGAWFASAGGAALIVIVSRRTGVARAAIGLRILQGLTIVAMGVLSGVVGLVTAYLACFLTHGASNPMHTTLLHRQVDAGHRTTVLSMNSMVSQPAGAVGAIVLTAIASETSLSTAMVVAGIACALAAPLYLPARRAERRRDEPPGPAPRAPAEAGI